MRIATFLAGIAIASTPIPAAAEPMAVEPGKWEFVRTAPDPATGAAKRQTNTECIRESSMTPQRFMAGMKGCTIHDEKTDASSMSWAMRCPSPAGEMTGSGAFQSTGATISGTLSLTVDMGGRKFPMTNDWTGKRVGECR